MIKDMIENVPVHVSMIMDGNGRWAKDRGKERVHGHFEGVESALVSHESGTAVLSICHCSHFLRKTGTVLRMK